MIPPHLFYQIYLSFIEQNNCTPPKCCELSEYTDSAHTEVEDPSLGCMNVSSYLPEVNLRRQWSNNEEGLTSTVTNSVKQQTIHKTYTTNTGSKVIPCKAASIVPKTGYPVCTGCTVQQVF